jgi:hypothetical protein
MGEVLPIIRTFRLSRGRGRAGGDAQSLHRAKPDVLPLTRCFPKLREQGILP